MDWLIPWIKPLLVNGVGVAFIVVGGLSVIHAIRDRIKARRISGTLVDYRERPDPEDARRCLYQAVYHYQFEGRDHEVLDEMSHSWKFREVGQPVVLLVHPDQPADAKVLRNWPLMLHAVFMLMGVGLLWLGRVS